MAIKTMTHVMVNEEKRLEVNVRTHEKQGFSVMSIDAGYETIMTLYFDDIEQIRTISEKLQQALHATQTIKEEL